MLQLTLPRWRAKATAVRAEAEAKRAEARTTGDDALRADLEETARKLSARRSLGFDPGTLVGATGFPRIAGFRVFILDEVYARLPSPPFSTEDREAVAADVYAHVWQQAVNGEFAKAA